MLNLTIFCSGKNDLKPEYVEATQNLVSRIDIEKEIKYLSQLFLMFDDPYQNGMNTVFGNFFPFFSLLNTTIAYTDCIFISYG